MARALVGHIGNASEQTLYFEVTRLRRRVAELQAELAELRHDQQSQMRAALELELHRIASDPEPALT